MRRYLVLGLCEGEPAVALHLRAEAHDVGSAHAGIEQQVERQARLGAHRVALLELEYLGHRPSVEAAGLALEIGHIGRRVVGKAFVDLGLDRPVEHASERLDAGIGRLGPLGMLVTDRADVARLHQREGLDAMLACLIALQGDSVEQIPAHAAALCFGVE